MLCAADFYRLYHNCYSSSSFICS